MPHRRKISKFSKKSSVRLRAHRIPPTVLTTSAQSTSLPGLPVLGPTACGVLPALPSSTRTPRPSRAASPVKPSISPWWALLVAAILGVVMVLALTALSPFALPATSHAYTQTDSEASGPASTPEALWKKGTVPHLYSNDQHWAAIPYGASTLGLSGAASTVVAMMHVYETGSTDVTPAEVTKWANENNAASTSPESVAAVLTQGAEAFGLKATPIEHSNIAIRQAVASGKPVVALLAQGANGPVETAVVICGIDRDSRLVVNDPTSADNTARSWSFEDVLDGATELYVYALAG